MQQVQLYINDKLVELTESIKIQLDKLVSDFRNPTKKTGSYSLSFTIPYTANNKNIFFNEQDKQVIGKFKQSYQARLVANGETLILGEFLHQRNSAKGFEGGLGTTVLTNPRLGDVLGDKKLTEIKSFTPVDFNGHETIINSWKTVTAWPDAEICYPYVIPSFSHLTTGFRSTYENIGVSHFMPAIVKNIFKDAGYEVEGDIFDSATFQKLFILYANTDNQAWNYGKLNVMEAASPLYGLFGGSYTANLIKSIERVTDTIHVVGYPFKVSSGDSSESLGVDGVYTCKYSGSYDFTVKGSATVQSGVNSLPNTGFTAFRCITDNEIIPENSIPSSSQFASLTTTSLDSGTIAVGSDAEFSFTARLEQGKQYQLQRYISVEKSSATPFFYSTDAGKFNITTCDGPLLVNPALFLPNLTQVELINSVFKLFNLYYQLNEAEKTVTLITRDNYFQEALTTIVDMSPYINLEAMEETPLSSAEIEQTYLAYTTDESDYILNRTSYLELVNGLLPDGATVLPYAPLCFVQVACIALDSAGNQVTGYDMLPAILPDTEIEDTSVLSDEDAISPTPSIPRIGLYEGADWLNDYNLFFTLDYKKVSLGRKEPTTPTYSGGFTGGDYLFKGFPPKLAFFDYDSQPVYKIVNNTALRSFALEVTTDENIYKKEDADFLTDITRIPELNTISLATNINELINPKGFFFSLYSNDLLIGNLSNYFEGTGRISPNLFNKLTGRQILRVQSDLFLLDSIKAFDVSGDYATYKMYKLLANTGTATASTIRFTSTASYTASCAPGSVGSDVTITATRSSFISQDEADSKALAAATQLANNTLVCTLPGGGTLPPPGTPSWTATKTYTARCIDFGMYGQYPIGDDVTITKTYVSYISQDDADLFAMAEAEVEAKSLITCQYNNTPI